MAIDENHAGIVRTSSFIAAGLGVVFGAFPGADTVYLTILWSFSTALIIVNSPNTNIWRFITNHLLTMLTVFLLFSMGIDLASAFTLPLFLIVNPILNFVFTYRVLRAVSKLFATPDTEEQFSNFISGVGFIIKTVLGI